MSNHAASPQSALVTGAAGGTGFRGRTVAILVTLAAALGVALVLAPSWVAAGVPGGGFANQSDLVAAVRTAFIGYWHSGDRALTPGLAHVVDYWFRYHMAKGVIGALLLIVLVVLGVWLWQTFAWGADLTAAKRVGLVSAGVFVAALALFSLAVVMANIQGMVAPLSSALSMLPLGTPSGQLTGTIDQVRQQLSDYSSAGGHPLPASKVMVDDFGRYHAAMVVIAATVASAFAVLSFVSWKRFARTTASEKRVRRALGVFGVLAALLSVSVFVVMAANITVARDPAPALLAFFQGGW